MQLKMKRVLTLLIFCAACLAQQTVKPDTFSFHMHTPLGPIPISAASALSPSIGPLGGVTPPAGVTVTSMWLVNTNSSAAVTVTATCTTGGAVLVDALIPGVTAGGNNIPVQMPADGVYCAGGVTWVASATGVNGYISGRY